MALLRRIFAPRAAGPGLPRRYARAYARLRARPNTFLTGQVLTFFVISLYVKFVQMRYTTEYGGAWLGSGRLLACWRDYALFCGQEIAVFATLLVAIMVWRRRPFGRFACWLGILIGWVVLPALSLAEILGIAHFALFLTPLGPEELRLLGWTGHMVSAGNVLQLPGVTGGLGLAGVGYIVAPPGLWVPDVHRWRPLVLATVACAAAATAVLPKPALPNALLEPHPVLWMVLGGRAPRIWALPADNLVGRVPDPLAAAVIPAAFAPQDRTFAPPVPRPMHGSSGKRLSVRERPTNVLIVILESTRAASVAFYNPRAAAGRNLLRLTDEAVVFEHIYAPVPTSAHALFSILYGVYPYLGPFWSGADRSVVADSMAQLFTRAGYASHFYITGDLDYDNVRSFAARGFETVLDSNHWPGQEAYAMLPWGRDDRLLIEQVKQFIGTAGRKPFFLVAMTSNPHHPYAVDHLPPVPGVTDDNGRAAYERLVDYDLTLVTELYEWMKRRGVAERTLLLVLGDHGEAFGEHAGNFGHAAFIYEENVHVPCFILHPRRLGLPRRIAQLGSQVDLRATIVDILGMHDSEPSDGVSLLRSAPDRQVINFSENGVSYFGVRDTRFSYIYTPHVATEQLFDRRADPQEAHDRAALDATVVAGYRTRLQRWENEHQQSLARVLR